MAYIFHAGTLPCLFVHWHWFQAVYLYICVLVCVSSTLGLKEDLDALKIVAAVGICLAWIGTMQFLFSPTKLYQKTHQFCSCWAIFLFQSWYSCWDGILVSEAVSGVFFLHTKVISTYMYYYKAVRYSFLSSLTTIELVTRIQTFFLTRIQI